MNARNDPTAVAAWERYRQAHALTWTRNDRVTAEPTFFDAYDAGYAADREGELLREMRRELCGYLDAQTITGENIGDVRRALFLPWPTLWNSWVRDETAKRERAADNGKGDHT